MTYRYTKNVEVLSLFMRNRNHSYLFKIVALEMLKSLFTNTLCLKCKLNDFK